jgi:phytoene dehydrogenase-like protein
MKKDKYDAVIIGSGPNGLAAGITLAEQGLSVLILEGKDTIGGGMRTKELTQTGFLHDVCSAIHPMAVNSPFFRNLHLEKYGLTFVHSPVLAAHPFDDGTASALYSSLDKTADNLGIDSENYKKLFKPILKDWEDLLIDFLGPLKFPKHPVKLMRFGLKALQSASTLAHRHFRSEKTKGLWAGMAAHSIQPLDSLTTSAIGLVLIAAGHSKGWPIPKGGSQSIANALAVHFEALGGEILTNFQINSFAQLPEAKAILFDTSPNQLLKIAGEQLSAFYKWQLSRYRYGMGVFKIDFALNEPIPFTAQECRNAGTVHLGGHLAEIATSEKNASNGVHSDSPFVLLAQQSLFDDTRAPNGKHTAWAYCHVPHGSTKDMTPLIEKQIERFAPGFKEIIIAKHTYNTEQMEAYNPNYVGGDINGGVIDVTQLFTRPTVRISPYKTSAKGIYICSASTPPGGGVHGMCGYHAAKTALKDVF